MTTETTDVRSEEPVETDGPQPDEIVEVEVVIDADAAEIAAEIDADVDTDAAGAADAVEPCGDEPLTARLEALLLGTDRPITEARLGALLGLTGRRIARRVRDAIDELNESYASTGRAFTAERVAAGWQLYTRPDFAPLMAGLQRERQHARLSPAALETLAIIAYRTKEGGVIRAEIEAIRGVSCGEVLRGLLERRLIKIVGRREDLGRPMLYGTTKTFLETFGLADLDDLPPVSGAGDAPFTPPQDSGSTNDAPPVDAGASSAEEPPTVDAAAAAETPSDESDSSTHETRPDGSEATS